MANQLPRYRQNIEAKVDSFHIPASGGRGKAAASVQEIVQELGKPPDSVMPSLPAGSKLKKGLTGPTDPTPVQVVQTPGTGWEKLRELSAVTLTALGTARIVIIFTIFMLLKREDLRNRLLRATGAINTSARARLEKYS